MKIIFLLILCFSLWGFYRLVTHFAKFFLSANWPTVECEIVDSKIDEKFDTADILGFLFPSFYPKIEYTYKLKGESYKSERISFDKCFHYSSILGFPGLAKAENLLSEFKKGKTAYAFYNPNEHSFSILIREFRFIRSIFVTVSLLSLLSYSLIGLYNTIYST